MGKRDVYFEALAELEGASSDFQPICDLFADIRLATSASLGGFLVANFGLERDDLYVGHVSDVHHVDLSRWPSGDDLRRKSERLAAAFNRARDAYRDMTSDEQAASPPPPARPNIRETHSPSGSLPKLG